MKANPILPWLLLFPLAAEELAPRPDTLRFQNGDQLEGSFAGLEPSGEVLWKREDVAEPMRFQPDKLRQIVLRHGRPAADPLEASHLELVNGDRYPGKVSRLDDDHIVLETRAFGLVELPRDTVKSFSPNPFGGRLLYIGPFEPEGWSLVNIESRRSEREKRLKDARDAAAKEGKEEEEKEKDEPKENKEAAAEAPKDNDKEKKKEAPKEGWTHLAGAWYFREGTDALTLDPGMTDRSIVRFRASWKSNPNIAFAFHADFQSPEAPKDLDDNGEGARLMGGFGNQNFSDAFGTCYVLSFYSSFAQLFYCGFDDAGNPVSLRLRSSSTNIRPKNSGTAEFELRCDRKSGTICLFVDGEFSSQWSTAEVDPDGKDPYKATGGGIGFQVIGNPSPVRISDVVVAEWNGLTDSARSMESEEHDIVLLTNGTDRFSGKVGGIRDGDLFLKGRFSDLKIPLSDVAQIHFASKPLRSAPEPDPKALTVHLRPIGRVTGLSRSATPQLLNLKTPFAGDISLDLAPASILELDASTSFLDSWDDDF